MESTVSVVLPTYNRRNLVLRALESVFQQTYRPIEVIVVDDCSTDGTCEALLRTVFPLKVDVVSLPTNQGPAAARNAGILRAAGKYVAFLDSDDLWFSDKLERVVTLLEASPNHEKTLAFSQVWIRRKHEALIVPARAKSPGESIADYLFANGGYVAASTVVMSTASARRVLHNPQMRLHEDWDFYIRLEEHGVRFVMLPVPLGIMFDTDTVARASAPRPNLSLAILNQWRPKISHRAYLSVRAKIAPQLRGQCPLRALRFITEAYLRGAINAWFSLALIGTLIHPKLRELAYFIRGRFSARSTEYHLCHEKSSPALSRIVVRREVAGSAAEE